MTHRLLLLLLPVLLAIPGFRSHGADPTNNDIAVAFEFHREANDTDLILQITNNSKEDQVLQAPDQRQIVQFVIMDQSGTAIAPQGVAKVDPARRDLIVKAGATIDVSLNEYAKIASDRDMFFSYLTGTGLFAHKLDEGKKYRVIAIYRAFGKEHEGFTSNEKLIEIQSD